MRKKSRRRIVIGVAIDVSLAEMTRIDKAQDAGNVISRSDVNLCKLASAASLEIGRLSIQLGQCGVDQRFFVRPGADLAIQAGVA